ncbi:MAG: ATP-binding protein, partial [Chitinophagia bacterium]|nr:ATP-binding protein [Chitinophagia bacterium]
EIFQIKKYHFANIEKQEAGHHVPFLIPPNHSNLYKLITTQPELLESIAFELKKIGGEYLYDQKSKISSVLKKVSDSYQFTLPFDSLADTLRRLLFYRTAVLTNKESVILFEEPETHFFPPYISGLMHDIISDRESGNQYFISSHSPYILNDLIENPNLNSELSIYAVSYKDSQTMIRRITDEQIEQIYQNGIDMFFNLDRFLDDED